MGNGEWTILRRKRISRVEEEQTAFGRFRGRTLQVKRNSNDESNSHRNCIHFCNFYIYNMTLAW